MQEGWRGAGELLRHDPWVLLGFLLIGADTVLFVHIQFKMKEVGYKTDALLVAPKDWGLPKEYLRIREKHGWVAWPAYCLWICCAVGIALLVFGLFRLHD